MLESLYTIMGANIIYIGAQRVVLALKDFSTDFCERSSAYNINIKEMLRKKTETLLTFTQSV